LRSWRFLDLGQVDPHGAVARDAWNQRETAPIRPPGHSEFSIGAGIRHHCGRKNRGVWRDCLEEEKLRIDRDGRPRTAYSLRHTYLLGEGGGLAISSTDSQTCSHIKRGPFLTRRDLVKAICPNRRGVDKSAWNPKELSRSEAESVVKAVFEEITDALNRGETVKLPFGKFEVKKHNRPPLRGWFLNRVRVTYRERRKYIEFTPGEGLPGAAIRRR
jgi:nucleoid DNA-binding protein